LEPGVSSAFVRLFVPVIARGAKQSQTGVYEHKEKNKSKLVQGRKKLN